MGIIAATAFNAGILVRGPDPADGSTVICNYRPATQEELERARGIERVCQAHGVPLPAAALQFSVAHPVVASLITGFGSPTEVDQCMEWMAHPIPTGLWAELKEAGLIDAGAPVPLA